MTPFDPSLTSDFTETTLSRDPQERMEPLVSEETEEMLASWVPGASRCEGRQVLPGQEGLGRRSAALGPEWGVLV